MENDEVIYVGLMAGISFRSNLFVCSASKSNTVVALLYAETDDIFIETDTRTHTQNHIIT